MSRLSIRINAGKLTYKPGEEVAGTVEWDLESPPQSLSLRLLWFTSGKAEPEVSLVDSRELGSPLARGTESFSFRLPAGPLSFVGQLVSLNWCLELVAEPGPSSTRLDLLLTETGRELQLPRLDPLPAWLKKATA